MPDAAPIRLMPGEDQVLASKYEADAAGGNALTNSFTGARISGDGNVAAAEAASLRAAGDPTSMLRAQQLMDQANAAQARAQAYAAPVGRYEDIHSLGDAGSWLAGQVGQGFGSSIDMLGAGVGMNALATGIGATPHPLAKPISWGLRLATPGVMGKMNYDVNKGEAYQGIQNDPVAMGRSATEINDEVSAHGLRAAAMDTLPQLLPVAQLGGGFTKLLKNIPSPAKIGGTLLGEGVTETGQQISQHYAQDALNPNRDTSGDRSELENSFLGGMAGSTGMAAAGHLGEKAWSRLAEPGDGKNGDVIPLNGKQPDHLESMKAASTATTSTYQERQDRANVFNRVPPASAATPEGAEAWEMGATAAQRDALVEELGKRKGDTKAAGLLQQLAAVDIADPMNDDHPALAEAAKYVTAKGGGFSPAELSEMGAAAYNTKGKKKNEQVAPSDLGSTTGGEDRTAPNHKSGEEIKARAAQNLADQKDYESRHKLNVSTVTHAFKQNAKETGLPTNPHMFALVNQLGSEMAAMATITDPTPGELARAERAGKTLASLLGNHTMSVLDALQVRNQAKVVQKQDTQGLGAPTVESPVFQAMYDRAAQVVESQNNPNAIAEEGQNHDTFAKSLVALLPNAVINGLISKGVNLAIQPRSREHFAKSIVNYAENPSARQKAQLTELYGVKTLDALVAAAGPQVQRRESVWEGTTGKTAATDSDTEGLVASEAETTAFEKAQKQKSHDKSPPETLVFHHGRGVGPVTSLKDAFKELSTGRLPTLLQDGKMNTVPDSKGGKPVESIARLLRNATDTLRGRAGDWAATGRSHVLRAASAREVMDSANIPDSKREKLMFRYLEQEGGPDVTDLKNMLGVVRSLEAYDRQYSAATIKRENIGPKGGKQTMAEANELAHPGAARGTLSKLADMAANPEDAALALSTFTMDTATRNTVLMGVVRRAKANALKHLTQTNGFRSFVASTQANEGRTPAFAELVNHFFSKRHMVVAEHKSDGDHLRMDLATFKTMAHDGLDLLATSANIGRKSDGAAFKKAAQIRAEHSMGLLRWYNSNYSPSKVTQKGDFSDKSARIVIQAEDLVAWVRKQRNAHEISTGKDTTRGENYGETRKNEDYLRDLTQGIMGLVDQGLVSGMPFIVNSDVHDVTRPTEKVDLKHANPKNLAGREEWFEAPHTDSGVASLKQAQAIWAKRAETEANIGPMPTQAHPVFFDGVPPSLDVGGRSYKQMVEARKFGHAMAAKDKEEFEESQGPANRAKGEKLAQDKHDAEVAGIDYAEWESMQEDEGLGAERNTGIAKPSAATVKALEVATREKLKEVNAKLAKQDAEHVDDEHAIDWENRKRRIRDVVTAKLERYQRGFAPRRGDGADAEAEDIDNTDMQSQEQQDDADAEAAGENKYADEREHIELMTSVLKSAADKGVRPLTQSSAFGIAGRSIAAELRAAYFAAGVNQEKLTDAIQRIMAYARSVDRPTSAPRDVLLTPGAAIDKNKPDGGQRYAAIAGDQTLGGHQYIAPMAMLLTPRFMAQVADTRKADLPLFEQLRSVTAEKMMAMMVPDPMSGIPELGGAKLATLVGMLSGKTEAEEQETLDKRVPENAEQAKTWEAGKAERLKWAAQDVTSAGREAFLKTLLVDTAGKAAPRKRARFSGTTFESVVSRYAQRAERISDDRIIKGEERLAAMEEKLKTLEGGSDEGYALTLRVEALRKSIHDAYAPATRAQPNAAATGDKTDTKSVVGAGPAPRPEVRKPKSAGQPDVGPAAPMGVRQKVNAKQQAEANEGGLGRTTGLAPFVSQETVDARTDEANTSVEALSKKIGSTVDALRAKPVVTKVEPSGLLTNPPAAPAAHQAKETAKLAGADLVLSPTSTQGYAGDLGRAAQAEGKLLIKVTPDVAGKTVLVSVPGKGRGFTAMPALIARVIKALDNGATVRTDNKDNAERDWNKDGEGALRAALIEGGFVETSGREFSSWAKGEVAQPSAKPTLRESIDKHTEFLRNPPEDYTTEKAAAIKGWAERQLVRVRGAIKTVGEDTDRADELSDMLDDLKNIIKDAEGAVWSDGELEKSLGPQGLKKNEQAAAAGKTTTAAPTTKPVAEPTNTKAFMAPPPKYTEIIKARAYLRKVLGPKITALLEDSFPGMTWNGDWDAVKQTVRIATANPIGIMNVAYHESMHAFFTNILAGNPEAKAMLERAFTDRKTMARLNALLDGSDKAKNAIANDPEERVAYAYQFWAMGLLDIDTKPTTFFERVQATMRRIFGAVRDTEHALAIFESFHDGKLAEQSEAGKAIAKIMGTASWRAKFLKKFDKLAQGAYSEVMANYLVGYNSESKAAQAMTREWYSSLSDVESAGKPGVIERTQMETKIFHNRLDLALKGLSGPNGTRDLKTLGESLNNHSVPVLPHLRNAYTRIQTLLGQYHEYARGAGIDIGERLGTGGDKDYYTRVMDLEYLVNHRDEFVAMLTSKYHNVLKAGKSALVSDLLPTPTEADVAEKVYQNFVAREGVDDPNIAVTREDGILNPLFNAGEKRNLYWIRDEDIAPFLSTNVVATMTQYLRQGVRAAEYTRTFGEGGELLRDKMARAGDARPVKGAGGRVRVEKYEEDGPVMTELREAATKAKVPAKEVEAWVNRRMDDLERMNGAMEGSLGKDITPAYRKFQGAIMTMQTLRLLPFMLFSSMLDPNGIRVAGGTHEDMMNAYKRGFTAVWHNWKDMLLGNPSDLRDADGDEMAALEAGVVDNLVHLEQIGTVASSEYSAGMTREINHAFFRGIGITHWDRAMRISATRAARRSIGSMIRGDSKEHSARWLKEIGLKPGQGTLDADGMLITTRNELAEHKGITREEAAAELVPIHYALNRWVTRAVVSPNAALRPTRASDPHYAMFYQFKSFTYAFQETTMRYAAHEAANGNTNADAQLLMGVPIMIAADMAKAMVMGGGSMPAYMANWTLADWVGHGFNRSGITGVGQIGVDALSDPFGLLGPTVGQVGDVLAAPFNDTVLKTGLDAVPGLRYARGAIAGSAGV